MRAVLASILPRQERANCLGLAYLKAFADSLPALSGRVQFSLLDLPLEDGPEAALRRILDEAPGLAGFHTQLCNEEAVSEVCRGLRAARPGVRLVLGGQEASLHPERLLRGTGADFVVAGEGEVSFGGLLAALLSGADPAGVPGLALLRDGRLLETAPRPLLEDLSVLPSPYLSGPLPPEWSRIGRAVIETTRGCPYSCSFCSWPNDARPRHFPLDRVREEIRAILRMDPTALVHFADPDLFLHRDRAVAIVRAIREADPDCRARYWFNAYFANFDEELAALCDHPGFILEGGIQSTNPRALEAARRRFDEAGVRRGLTLLRERAPRANLTVQIILGLPGDTLGGFLQSLEWIVSAGGAAVQVFRMQLFPGTRFHREKEQWGIEADPLPPYAVHAVAGFPAEDLRRGRFAARRVHLLQRHPRAWAALREAEGPLWAKVDSLIDYLEREAGLPMTRAFADAEAQPCTYLTPLDSGSDPFEGAALEKAAEKWLARQGACLR